MAKPSQISERHRSPAPQCFAAGHLPPSRVCACVFLFDLRGRDCRIACVRVRDRVRQNKERARQGLWQPAGSIIMAYGYIEPGPGQIGACAGCGGPSRRCLAFGWPSGGMAGPAWAVRAGRPAGGRVQAGGKAARAQAGDMPKPRYLCGNTGEYPPDPHYRGRKGRLW